MMHSIVLVVLPLALLAADDSDDAPSIKYMSVLSAPPVPLPEPVPPACACKEQQYCKPLATPPPDHELFPFVVGSNGSDWYDFRWDLVTTAGYGIGFNESVCYAHKQGARVVINSGWGLYGGPSAIAPYVQLLFNRVGKISQTGRINQ